MECADCDCNKFARENTDLFYDNLLYTDYVVRECSQI